MTDSPVSIVTAAGQGMGAAIARRLADAGHQLVLTSNGGGAEQLADDLPSAVAVSGSVADPEYLAAVVGMAMEHFGRIDAVVNNTGHAAKGDLLELTDEDWHHGLDLLLLNVVDEIASVAVFLVSDESSYVTGQNIRVDGGLARSV